MEEIEFIRAADDRRTYELGTIGSLRLNGWFMRSATARAGGDSFLFERASWFSSAVDAKDDRDRMIGAFRPRRLRRGGAFTWRETEFNLCPVTPLRQRYQLVEGERDLASIEARGWWGWGTRRPLNMQVLERGLDPGLLLFVAFIVRTLADKSDSAAGSASVVANTGRTAASCGASWSCRCERSSPTRRRQAPCHSRLMLAAVVSHTRNGL